MNEIQCTSSSRCCLVGALLVLLAVALAAEPAAPSTGKSPGKTPGKAAASSPASAASTLPALSILAGRPTGTSVALSLAAAQAMVAELSWKPADGQAAASGSGQRSVSLQSGIPATVEIDGLTPDRTYVWTTTWKAASGTAQTGPSGSWRTARPAGSSFSFAVIGDSHPERVQQFDPVLYRQTLAAAAASGIDFFMTIGDDFSVDTLKEITPKAVEQIYRNQHAWLSTVGSQAPVFLVNGNHEQASRANLDGTPDNVAVWAQLNRNRFFPQPAPDAFYAGDAEQVPHIGLLRDYYSFTWGDALIVVIDPYWHSTLAVDNALGGAAKTRDLWNNTLGDAQYAWLKSTLEQSKARFKIVLSHHVLGTGRGGIELAGGYEWGGQNAKGTQEFASRRPGWELPLHQLFVKTKVSVFVQGHDHIFARQLLDGVTYLTLPEPADPNSALYNDDAFKTGDKLPNSGFVRFAFGGGELAIEYWRQWLPGSAPAGLTADHGPAYRYLIGPNGPADAGVFDPLQREAAPATGTIPPHEPAAKTPKQGARK